MRKNKFCLINVCVCFCLVLSAALILSACAPKSKKRLLIVCSAFPQYDWVKVIVAERTDVFEIKYLMESGVDLHNYYPSIQDSAAVLNADLVIPTGASADPWIMALSQQSGKKLNSISLGGIVQLLKPLDGDHDWDEHVWLSIKNAALCVDAIAEKIIELDAKNAEYYRTNADAYIAELNGLDAEYAAAAGSANARDTVVIADRFPFLYLFTDYGIKHYAAFDSCSAATDVPISRIAYLIEKVNEFDIKVILKIEGSSAKCAETVRDNSNAKNQQILTLHSVQSVSRNEINGGFNYLDTMKDNLPVFKTALTP